MTEGVGRSSGRQPLWPKSVQKGSQSPYYSCYFRHILLFILWPFLAKKLIRYLKRNA